MVRLYSFLVAGAVAGFLGGCNSASGPGLERPAEGIHARLVETRAEREARQTINDYLDWALNPNAGLMPKNMDGRLKRAASYYSTQGTVPYAEIDRSIDKYYLGEELSQSLIERAMEYLSSAIQGVEDRTEDMVLADFLRFKLADAVRRTFTEKQATEMGDVPED